MFILPQILADFANPPERTSYYSMFDNDHARSKASLMGTQDARAYLDALSRSDFFRDVHRGFSNSFADLSPLTFTGRTSFAGNENMSLSDVYPAAYYNSVQDLARRLYGAEKLSQNNELGIKGLQRLPDFDNEYADWMVTQALNANLPMDIPEVKEYALKLFRSGQSLDEVAANTRSEILRRSNTSSLKEYLENRPDNIFDRGLRIAGSTLPVKLFKDTLGYNDINQGFYSEGGQDIKNAKGYMMYPALLGMLPVQKIPKVGKALKTLLGPGMITTGIGANAAAAHSNLRDLDARKRFVMNAVRNGQDPTKLNPEDIALNAAQVWYTLPYQMFTGADQMTQLKHAYKMLTDDQYKQSIKDYYKDMDVEGMLEASGTKVRDKRGRLLDRKKSTSEMFAGGAGDALNWALYAGPRRSKYILPVLAAYGAGKGVYKGLQKWGDKNNGAVTDNEFNKYLAEDRYKNSSSKMMRELSPYIQSAETGARMFANLVSHPIDSFDLAGRLAVDGIKYGIHNFTGGLNNKATDEDKKKKRDLVYKTDAITDEEVRQAYERRKKALNSVNKKTASDEISSLVPQAGVSQDLEALRRTKLEMLPKARAAYGMADAYDQLGKYGPAGVASLLALKPRNAISNIFGDSRAYVEDLRRVRDEANRRYRSKPYGFLPTAITSPFSRDARALHIAKKVHKDVDKFTKKNAFPLALIKTSAAGILAALLLNKLTQPRMELPIYDYQQ